MGVVVEVPGREEVLVTQRRRKDIVGGASSLSRGTRVLIRVDCSD
jgi:hypothetical protein